MNRRVRHFTPTYFMTNEMQLLNYAINKLHLAYPFVRMGKIVSAFNSSASLVDVVSRCEIESSYIPLLLILLLCVRAEYWKARLSRRCPSYNKVRNQVPVQCASVVQQSPE